MYTFRQTRTIHICAHTFLFHKDFYGEVKSKKGRRSFWMFRFGPVSRLYRLLPKPRCVRGNHRLVLYHWLWVATCSGSSQPFQITSHNWFLPPCLTEYSLSLTSLAFLIHVTQKGWPSTVALCCSPPPLPGWPILAPRVRTRPCIPPARQHTCFAPSSQRPASLRQLPPVPYGSRLALVAPFLAPPAETCQENWGSCCSCFQEMVCSACLRMALVPRAWSHMAGLALVHASGCWHWRPCRALGRCSLHWAPHCMLGVWSSYLNKNQTQIRALFLISELVKTFTGSTFGPTMCSAQNMSHYPH